MRITAPTRLPKIQEHRITKGSIANTVTKPEQSVIVYVKCGSNTYRKNISNSVTIGDLKKELVRTGVVTFLVDEFELSSKFNVDAADGMANRTVLLDDDSLSLHYYGFQKEANLTLIGPHITLDIVDTLNKRTWRMFSRWTSLKEMKNILASVRHFDFFMFVKSGNDAYRKLDIAHDIFIDQVFTDGDTIYLSKNDFFLSFGRIYLKDLDVGKVGFGGESVLSLKLRTQLLTGVPV